MTDRRPDDTRDPAAEERSVAPSSPSEGAGTDPASLAATLDLAPLSEGELHRLETLRSRFGVQRLRKWAADDVPVSAMGCPGPQPARPDTGDRVSSPPTAGPRDRPGDEFAVQRLSQEDVDRLLSEEVTVDFEGLEQYDGVVAEETGRSWEEEAEFLESLWHDVGHEVLGRVRREDVLRQMVETLGSVRAHPYLDPEDVGSIAGATSQRKGDDDAEAELLLAPSADESTVAHELGHLLNEAYHLTVGPDVRPTIERFKADEFPRCEPGTERHHRLVSLDATMRRPKAIERLRAAVGDAWQSMQDAHEAPDESVAMYEFEPFYGPDHYAALHSEETFAHFNEQLQRDDLLQPANWWYRHPELTRAYVDVWDPAPKKRALMHFLHEQDPAASPFESNPYPDATPDEKEMEHWQREMGTLMAADDSFPDRSSTQAAGYYEYESEHYPNV